MFLPLDAGPPPLRPAASAIAQQDWEVLARFWYPVATRAEIGAAPFAATLLDVDLVLYASGDGITAAVDLCPHRWVRLSSGTVTAGAITCPFHGLTFNGTGQCVRVPALGRDARLPASYRVRTFRTECRHGMLWVCLDDASTETLPEFPTLHGRDDSALAFGIWTWPMSAARQIENFIDLAHLPFVHASTLGGDQEAKVAPARIEERATSIFLSATFVETVPFETPTRCDLTYEVFLPFAIDFSSTPDGATGFRSVNIASPVTAHRCRVFQIIVRGAPGEIFDDAGPIALPDGGPGVINQQDIDILSTLRIPDLPLTEKAEIHLPVDNVSAAYRRRLRQIGLGRATA